MRVKKRETFSAEGCKGCADIFLFVFLNNGGGGERGGGGGKGRKGFEAIFSWCFFVEGAALRRRLGKKRSAVSAVSLHSM